MLDLKKQDRQESYYILRLAWVAGCASAIAFGFLLNDVTHGVFSYTISQFLPHPPFWWTGSKITCLQESSDQVGSLEAGTRCHELWSGQRPRWGLNHPRMLWKSLWGSALVTFCQKNIEKCQSCKAYRLFLQCLFAQHIARPLAIDQNDETVKACTNLVCRCL